MAEKGCWPDWDMAFGRDFCLRHYPKVPRFLGPGHPSLARRPCPSLATDPPPCGSSVQSPTPYRFLNSGVWMGYAERAYALLTELQARGCSKCKGAQHTCAQRLTHRLTRSHAAHGQPRPPAPLSQAYTPGLDDQHVVGHMFVDRPEAFALDYNSTLFQSLQGDGVGSPAAVHPAFPAGGAAGPVRNSLTGARPLVLHFNGGSKPKFNGFRDHLLKAARGKCLRPDTAVASERGPLPLERVCPGWRHKSPQLVCPSAAHNIS